MRLSEIFLQLYYELRDDGVADPIEEAIKAMSPVPAPPGWKLSPEMRKTFDLVIELDKDTLRMNAKEYIFHFSRIVKEMPGDPYTNTARHVTGNPNLVLTKEQREECKALVRAVTHNAKPGAVLDALRQRAMAQALRQHTGTRH